MKTSLVIGLGVLVVGAGIYLIYKSGKNQEKHSLDEKSTIIDDSKEASKNIQKESDSLVNEKNKCSSTISERHLEAASIIKESLNKIYDDDKSIKTENSDDINAMNEDLDEMLK